MVTKVKRQEWINWEFGINIRVSLICVQLFKTPWTEEPARLLGPWDFPGKNTGVGCYFLLQGILLTQGLNLHLLRLLHCACA